MNYAINVKGKHVSLFWHFLAIIPPVFLLTFRAEECGTDTTNYIRMFDAYDYSSWAVYISTTRLEILFALLMYGVYKMNLSVEYLFFLCGILTVVPVYVGAMKMKEKLNPLVLMALFYLMFYHYSFNIVRQSIAMSLLFLAVVYLIENKKIISLGVGVAAFSFHIVAVIYFLFFFIIDYARKISFKVLFLNTLILLLLLYFFQYYFSEKLEYMEGYLDNSQKVGMQNSYFVEMIINFVFIFLFWTKNRENLYRPFLMISALTLFTILISTISLWFFRVANCIDILLLLYIPLTLRNSNKSLSKMLYVSYMSFAVFFWWFVFIYNGSGRSYPYILSPQFNLL